VLLVLLIVVAAVGLGGRHAWAWYQLRAARSALTRYHPAEAREHLESCLKVWPKSVAAHLLASRAARQSGDFEEAQRHLRACQDLLEGTSEEVALEWALLRAASGNVRGEDEVYLQRKAEQEPAQAPLIWEALAEGYILLYRHLDAFPILDQWLRLDPDNLRARELRGLAYYKGKAGHKAAEDFRWVLGQDPTREETRERLVLCLLDMGSYDEALPHLEHIARLKPDDPDVQVRLARCHSMLGREEQARQMLDAVLAQHPGHALALRTRGQFALTTDHQPAQAEAWLRRAVKVAPNDYQAQFLLHQALQQQPDRPGKAAEADAQLKIAEEVKDRAERLGELSSRKLSERPLDPALHCEMGVLLLRSGHRKPGVSWLLSALRLDPDYQPAHAALAEYYARQGDKDRAAEHRRLAGTAP
jgi:tetratricopeptide (TPR) repeat protein